MESRGRGALAPETACFPAQRAGRFQGRPLRTQAQTSSLPALTSRRECESAQHSRDPAAPRPGAGDGREVASKLMLVLSLEN